MNDTTIDQKTMTLEQWVEANSGPYRPLNFYDQERLTFVPEDDGSLLVCFDYIRPIDDDLIDPAYAALRAICMKHGAPGRIKCRDSDTGPFYAFRIPTESSKDCYEELKRNSV